MSSRELWRGAASFVRIAAGTPERLPPPRPKLAPGTQARPAAASGAFIFEPQRVQVTAMGMAYLDAAGRPQKGFPRQGSPLTPYLPECDADVGEDQRVFRF
jgi:hypothetical protein